MRGELSFASLRRANIARQDEWPGTADLAFRIIEVAGEAGEVAEAGKKYLRSVRGIGGSTASRADIAQELADLVIAADLLAEELDLDLGDAIRAKFNKTSLRLGLRTLLPEWVGVDLATDTETTKEAP